jgi:hypothetical protein
LVDPTFDSGSGTLRVCRDSDRTQNKDRQREPES